MGHLLMRRSLASRLIASSHRPFLPLHESVSGVDDFAGCDEINFRIGFSLIFIRRSVR